MGEDARDGVRAEFDRFGAVRRKESDRQRGARRKNERRDTKVKASELEGRDGDIVLSEHTSDIPTAVRDLRKDQDC